MKLQKRRWSSLDNNSPASRSKGVADHLARRAVWTFLGLGGREKVGAMAARKRMKMKMRRGDGDLKPIAIVFVV